MLGSHRNDLVLKNDWVLNAVPLRVSVLHDWSRGFRQNEDESDTVPGILLKIHQISVSSGC